MFVPKFGEIVPPLGIFVTSIWVFLSPTFGKIEDQKNPKVGDKNSQGQEILKGARFPQIWAQKHAKVGGKKKQKLGTIIQILGKYFLTRTFGNFWKQLLGKLRTTFPKSWGQKIPKVGGKKSQRGQQFPKFGDNNCKTASKEIAQ